MNRFTPQPFNNSPVASLPTLLPEAAASGQDCVRMEFPTQVVFTPEWGLRVLYTPGVHDVPVEWSTDPFLIAFGAAETDAPKTIMPAQAGDSRPSVVLDGHSIALDELAQK